MNNQPRNNSEQESQQQIDQTVELLESINHPERQQSLDAEQQSIVELASAARASVATQLPQPNQTLRQQLIEATAKEATAKEATAKVATANDQPFVGSQPSASGFPVRRWATAAALMVGLGVTGWTLSGFGTNDSGPTSVTLKDNSKDVSSLSSIPQESKRDSDKNPPMKTEVNELEGVKTYSFSPSKKVGERSTDSVLDDVLNESGITETYDDADAIGALPEIATNSTSTVVTVPDGGTVLFGGVKLDSQQANNGQRDDRYESDLAMQQQGQNMFTADKQQRSLGQEGPSLDQMPRSAPSGLSAASQLGTPISDVAGEVAPGTTRFRPLNGSMEANEGLERTAGGSASRENSSSRKKRFVAGGGGRGYYNGEQAVTSFYNGQAVASSKSAPGAKPGQDHGFADGEHEESTEGRFQSKIGGRNTEDRSRERYVRIYENSFTGATGSDAVSTFSIDVDTASYANTRRFLNSGQLPPPDAVRIEELINYFPYNYEQPTGADPFSVDLELAACPWEPKHKLVRVGIKGKEVAAAERKPTHLVFLLDVSGSMNSANKLPLLKRGFKMMVDQLNENDRVTIVTYAGQAGLALEPTTGDQKSKINQAIDVLTPGGSTHGSAGIELAYQLAQQNFIQDGNNKVILATDGDLNVGVTKDKPLVELIKQKSSEGVFLTVLGFGTGNLQDGKMEQLADNGNGMYCYIDSVREARKVLVEQMTGSLVTIAKDVKIQVEFNPKEVHSYRLIGYENRLLAAADFNNDRKDAGEIGAGHTVTAIYEVVTSDQADEASASSMALKYQTSGVVKEPTSPVSTGTDLTDAAASGELLTLAMRYKQPDSNTSKRIDFAIANEEKRFDDASEDFRFTASVAAYGMLLRGSEHAGNATAEMVEEIAASSMGSDAQGYRAEFIDLVRKAKTLLKTTRR